MSNEYIKDKISKPQLSRVGDIKIIGEPVIMQQLKFLNSEELGLDEDYSGSDMTDPLEEPKNNTEEKVKQVKERFNKLKNDYRLMNSFSNEYLKTIEELRKEIKVYYIVAHDYCYNFLFYLGSTNHVL